MIKNILVVVLVIFWTNTFSQEKPSVYKHKAPGIFGGKLSEKQLVFLKENYQWKDEEKLIVNYRTPRNRCWYNQYSKVSKQDNSWFDAFYSQLSLQNTSIIYVHSSKNWARKIIKNRENHFEDVDDFFIKTFHISKSKQCYAAFLINKKGKFYQINGEYTEEQIAAFINDL